MVRIRVMTEADVPAVSALRVRGWREAYAGIVPRGYLDAMDADEDAARRREMLVRAAGRVHNLVAVAEGEAAGETEGVRGIEEAGADADSGDIVGWAAFGPYRGEPDDTGTGELYALYLRPERIGSGIGRALTAEVLRRSAELGRERLALWVLAGNARARRFYATAGFRPDGGETSDTYDGVPLRELRYVRPLAGGPPVPATGRQPETGTPSAP